MPEPAPPSFEQQKHNKDDVIMKGSNRSSRSKGITMEVSALIKKKNLFYLIPSFLDQFYMFVRRTWQYLSVFTFLSNWKLGL
jgi:hypothetical protein